MFYETDRLSRRFGDAGIDGWSQLGHAQPAGIDPQAEKLLRRMSDYLAGRQQFTLKAESSSKPC